MAERQREEEENQAILEETDKKDGQASHLLVTEEFPEGVELNNKEEEALI